MLLKPIGVTIMAMLIVSCASSRPINYEDISDTITSGEMAGVVGSFKPSGSRVLGIGKDLLLSGSLTVSNLETEEQTYIFLSEKGSFRRLAPGRYKIDYGGVRGPEVRGNLPLIQLWVEEFELSGGEVVDLGELAIDRIKVNVQTDGVGKTFNALMSLGTDINDDQTYVTYEVRPSSDKDIKRALKKYPQLQTQVTSRPLKLRFTETEFRAAIELASARTETGQLPTRYQIRRKLESFLIKEMAKTELEGNLQ